MLAGTGNGSAARIKGRIGAAAEPVIHLPAHGKDPGAGCPGQAADLMFGLFAISIAAESPCKFLVLPIAKTDPAG